MKTLKLLFVALFATLLLGSCTKDEDGQWIKYYKNKTGVGYVFYKWDNDSIAPIPNLKMQIESHTRGSELFPGKEHIDYIYTNDNGKYEFKVLKKIDGEDVVSYFVIPIGKVWDEPISYSGSIDFYSDDEDNRFIDFDTELIDLDTIFYFPDRTLWK